MKKTFVAVLLGLVFVLLPVFSTAIREVEPLPEVEAAPVPAEVSQGLATVYAPPRYVPVRPAQSYGNYLVLSNKTGYILNRFDVFNDQMYLDSNSQVDLFGGKVVDEERYRIIMLDDHPDLKDQLFRKDGSIFYLNAIDADGDMYFREWDPETESWNLELTFDDLVYDDIDPAVESFGDYLLVANRTGSPLTELYLQLSPYGEGELTTNVLGDMGLVPGETVKLQTSDLPWLSDVMHFNDYGHVYVIAIDIYGTHYVADWYPTTDLWRIELYSDLVVGNPDAVWIRVVNETPWLFWTLYAMTDEMFEAEELGEDLLGEDILSDGEETFVDISSVLPYDGPIHFLAFDSEDLAYHQVLLPDAPVLEVVFTEEDSLEEVIPVSLP